MSAEFDIEYECPAGAQCGLKGHVDKLREQVEELSQLVRTDPLTGLNNYRHFHQALDQEMERSRRSGQACSLLLVDLDHFKAVNDEHGHEVGNLVLIQTAKLIRQSLRKLDIPCRYGGEEFTLILPNTALRDALMVAERVRSLIATTPLQFDGGTLSLTASIGADIFNRQDDDTVETFTARVDAQLYRAKESGRDRVCSVDLDKIERRLEVSADEKDALFGLFGSDD
jgi:diguanylate cyclase (GGDEF)-like protein